MSEPAEAAAVARKLLEVISHSLHELSTSSRGAVVSSLCFSWVTLFTPAFFRSGSSVAHRLLTSHSKTRDFESRDGGESRGNPSSSQKAVSGKELPLTFHQPATSPDACQYCSFPKQDVRTVCLKSGDGLTRNCDQDSQGLSRSTPMPSKSVTFLVATVRPCTRAVAAMRASRSERGLGT